MNLTQRLKLLKHFGSLPPEPPPPLLVVPKPGMEDLTIWEQHTITLNKDPKFGFGFAISGGKDKPHPDTGDTAVVVSDVLPNGPAMGRLFTKDQIVMVNGQSMANVHSNYTIQTLKSCGKTADITVKRPRTIQIPATNRPARAASHSNLLDVDPSRRSRAASHSNLLDVDPSRRSRAGSHSNLLDADPPRRTRRYSDGSDNRDDRYRTRSSSPGRNGYGNTLPLMSSGYKKLPRNDFPDKPIKTTLVKKRITDEYGLKLGSQIFIKHMTDTGLAAKEGTLQEGDLILKINGMTTENLSLLETKHLVEKSRGKLTMTVLRDDRKFLVSIPEVEDSAPNSEDDRRRDSSSELEDISDIDDDVPTHRASRHPTREKRTRRTRAEPPPPAKSRDSSPVRATLSRPPPKTYAPRRAPSESESDHSVSPPRVRKNSADRDPSSKYKPLSGISALPNPRSSPVVPTWNTSRPTSSASRPRRPVSDSDSDRSASPPQRRESPRPDTRYKVLPDLPAAGLKSSPITVRQEPPRRVNSPVRVPPPDSDSDSDSVSGPPQRHTTSYSPESLSRYRVLPAVSLQPTVEPPRWSKSNELPQRAQSDSESEASYASVPRQQSTDNGNSNTAKNRYRVLPEKSTSVPVKQEPPRRAPSPVRPPPDDSSDSDQLSHLRRSGSSEREDSRPRAPRAPNGTGTLRSGISVKNNPPVYSKPTEEPIYSLPPDSYPSSNPGYSSDVHTVSFIKERSIGLRLVGGNDVGIFVGGVQPNSPAYEQGMKDGDQILQVNKVEFGHFTREEAANFLLNIKTGEPVEICTQNKMDLYKKITKSNLGDNFYIRTHFDHEPDGPIGLAFTRGEVFRVVDTMHRGKIGNWLAIRMGNDLHEMDKGTIPNQARAEKLASLEQAQRGTGERQVSGPRAEFWKLRGLRGNKKNEKNTRRSRDDLLQLTIQGKFPAYERVLLREANFKRPIVILGPLNDIAMEKLAREMPDEYEVADMVPRSGGGDSGSTVIKLDTVRRIAEKDKHPLLDITPTAVERLNYIQYHPMVLFLDPHSRKDVKAMRQRYSPNSSKSSRRLYAQALKMRKHCSHLFSARVDLQPGSNVWYDALKEKIRHQQSKPVWVSEVTLESGGEQDLDALDQTQSDYLSAASDLEDTDGEAFTDGEVYTDNEDLDEAYPGQDAARIPRSSRAAGAALARSSEPAFERESPTMEVETRSDTHSLREVPPLMHVPEPRTLRRNQYSPPHSPAEEDPSHRSFTDSDFSALDVVAPTTPSDGPPDFVAPDPSTRYSLSEPSYADVQPESSEPASLSTIEEKLQQARSAEPQAQAETKKAPQFIVLAHHHQAVQFRRTQIRGSDSSDDDDDDEDEDEDIEWGPATEL
ncbi:tight junction protein ZO-3 isoform X1 [Acanthochromis polyacanthus]|uniref:tight junction protein ZO-3 isoform X1 n=2 Tax=Acanthochromis polyacanthus TaxID=80966 RepID=UPI002234083F|nr:tight junction protein ZO-3 isoform X1 [Acanthochromis polyacanthus]